MGHRRSIAEGVEILQAALARDRLGEFQAQAAIAALHADAPQGRGDRLGADRRVVRRARCGSPTAPSSGSTAPSRSARPTGRGPGWPPCRGGRVVPPLRRGAAYLHERDGDLGDRRPALRRGRRGRAEPRRARPPDPPGGAAPRADPPGLQPRRAVPSRHGRGARGQSAHARGLGHLRCPGRAPQRHLRRLLVHLVPPRLRRAGAGLRGQPSAQALPRGAGRAHAAWSWTATARWRGASTGRRRSLPTSITASTTRPGLQQLPDYRLTCIFIDKAYRRRGLTRARDARCARPDRPGGRRGRRGLPAGPLRRQAGRQLTPLQQHPRALRGVRLHLRPAQGQGPHRHA